MKSISSVGVLVASVAILGGGGGVESFAPSSLSSRKVDVSSVTHHVHKTSTLSSRQPLSTTTTTPLFTLNKDNTGNDTTPDNDTPKVRPTTISRRKQILRSIHQKSKPITLAILTSTATQFLPGLSNLFTQPANAASAPIVLRANKKKDDPPMIQAQKKAEELKKAKSLEEFDIFMAKANDIEISEGKAARNAYEKQYQLDKAASEAKLQKDVIKLKQSLLDEGQDPYTDLDAERQVWLLEHNLDLEKVSGTPQNEQMIKTKLSRKKNAVPTYEKQRYIIKCQVADLKARGLNPLEHFAQPSVQEKTRAIYKMDDKVAAKVARQYEELMTKYNGRLTEPQDGEGVPFTWDNNDVLADEVVDGKVIAVGGSDKAKKREERAALKAKRAAERERAKAARAEERAAAKAKRAEDKATAKAEREAAKEAKLAEKAAAAAGVTAAVGASVAGTALSSVSSPMVDGEIAATANGDISATAGTNAVSSDLVETTSSSSDLLTKVKKVATKRNVGTVVIGGSAALYGINYYKENNAATVSSREEQLRLILGDDDDDEDDDDFDDDDEDDDFAKFTQKKKKKRTPPEDESPSAPKASAPPPTPPTPPAPAPKPRVRKLGIFSKRNANARETDLNVLISSDAKAPQFATLLSQILTFGAPGRFPVIAAWSTPMPFDKFDLEEAKSLLFSSRKDAKLTDEESAEIFASVVNCMIIDIVDLASVALKAKDKDEKVAVDAINVVMDFMDHAASLFDAVAEDVTIKPVTYGGNLRKKDLEQMFSVYAGSSMMSLDAMMGGEGGSSQDRVDTLQLVFAITDKKAEGLMQKHMMKMMMNLMKDGGKGLEGMMGDMGGMEGMEEMMAAMGGAGGMPGMPGMDGEMSPEDLKQTLGMMKDLMESGQVSEDELVEVRKQFKEMYGSDIGDLIKKAGDEAGSMTEDEAELLDMFKKILGE